MNSALDILGIVFVVLKLCGVISWKWIYVLIPFIMEILIILISIIIGLVMYKK